MRIRRTLYPCIHIYICEREREKNVLFNDALNTFYLRLYGVRHMVKDHSDSEKGNPLPPYIYMHTYIQINTRARAHTQQQQQQQHTWTHKHTHATSSLILYQVSPRSQWTFPRVVIKYAAKETEKNFTFIRCRV